MDKMREKYSGDYDFLPVFHFMLADVNMTGDLALARLINAFAARKEKLIFVPVNNEEVIGEFIDKGFH